MAEKTNKGLSKTTSLQAWSKLTEEHFGRKLRIEDRKDREAIYSLLEHFKLPHERFHVFKSADRLKKEDFLEAIGDLGTPYWISATPKRGEKNLNRLSKLGLENAEDGWKFIRSLPKPEGYKVIVMEYPENIQFKGSAVVSKELNGIVDFVKGDQHFQLTAGLTITDPMLFDSSRILRYSKLVDKKQQEMLYSLVSGRRGHYEFQYGTTPDGRTGITFFDYNDELAYENIDLLFNDLKIYLNEEIVEENILVKGFPASLGKAIGKVKVVLSSDVDSYKKVERGDILVSDSTNPDMVPVMEKVSAIITDLGGVTSHAAIVCRELGMPCIAGATNATEVLKDGMLVEVDAFKGIVKAAE